MYKWKPDGLVEDDVAVKCVNVQKAAGTFFNSKQPVPRHNKQPVLRNGPFVDKSQREDCFWPTGLEKMLGPPDPWKGRCFESTNCSDDMTSHQQKVGRMEFEDTNEWTAHLSVHNAPQPEETLLKQVNTEK